MVNGKQLNVWFLSSIEYTGEQVNKNQFREMAKSAVLGYLKEVRDVPQTGNPEALAIWPEILPTIGVVQPLDAFEIND